MAFCCQKLDEDLLLWEGEVLGGSSRQGVQEILWSLLYGVAEARLRAAEEIRRLSKSSSKCRAYLAAAGVIIPLVSMLKSSCVKAKEASIFALLGLAFRNERNKVKIVKAGAIKPLAELLQSESVELREAASATVLTLSASNANKPIIGASGVVPLLVEMLISGSLQGKVDAVMALSFLSTYPDNVVPILDAGAVTPLVILLKECKKSCKVAEKITALLGALMVFEDGRSAVTQEEGGVLAMVEVLEDGSPESREHAVGALLTMCESSSSGRSKYKDAILGEGVIPGLLELTVQGTLTAQQKARTLLELLRDPPHPSRRSTSLSSLSALQRISTSHVDGGEPGAESSKKMLTEMAHLTMHHLKQSTVDGLSSDPSTSS